MIEHKRKEHLEKYDRFFKQFKYSKALDAAMEVCFAVSLRRDIQHVMLA